MPTWDDRQFEDAVRAKGARMVKAAKIVQAKSRMMCRRCHKPIAIAEADHCRCGIFDVR